MARNRRRRFMRRANRGRSARLVGRRPGRERAGQTRIPFLETIIKGAKSLLSTIPGSTWIGDMASFAWKAINMSAVEFDGSNYDVLANTKNPCCLSAQFTISPSVIMAGSVNTVAVTDNPVTGNYSSTFYDARVRWLRVKLIPSAKMSERQGVIALAFLPFRNVSDEATYKADASIQYFDRVMRRPGARSGPATTPLAVTWVPSVLDGFGYQYHPLTEAIGLVVAAFQDTAHANDLVNYSPEVATFSVAVEGELGCRQGSVTTYKSFKMTVNDFLKGKTERIITPNGDYTFSHDESGQWHVENSASDFEMM